jgi:hypothetical protein
VDNTDIFTVMAEALDGDGTSDAKNVILMIADGAGFNAWTATTMYEHGIPGPLLIASEPAADGTLPKTQNNVLILTFDSAIAPPGGPPLNIINLHDATDVSGSFACTVEPDGVTLKATENGAVLANQNWYRVTPGAGFGVQAFVLDVCTLQGDGDGGGQVLVPDYFLVKNHMGQVTDARYDLDGSGQVLVPDYFVVKNHMGNAKPAKP